MASMGTSPCTREDVSLIISDGLGPLHLKLDRIESMIQRLATENVRVPQLRRAVTYDPSTNEACASAPTHQFSPEPNAVAEEPSTNRLGNDEASIVSNPCEGIEHHQSTKGSHVWAASATRSRSVVSESLQRVKVNQEMAVLGAMTGKNHFQTTVLPYVQDIMRWWVRLEEPPRRGCLYKFVKSSPFAGICSSVILLNTFTVAYTADFEMKHVGQQGKHTKDFMTNVEYGFLIFYTLELLCRLAVHRLYFFVNDDLTWNWLDFVLVLISGADTLISRLLNAAGNSSIGFMRILRICKVAKVLRVFRAMRFFTELAVMIDSFRQAFIAMFWGIVMILLLLYIFAVLFLQALATYLSNEIDHIDPSLERQIRNGFGSFYLSLLSLYAAVTGGKDWIEDYDMIKLVGGQYAAMYLLFIFFFLFAVFNILTGMFVEKATLAALPDRDELVLAKKRKATEEAKEFRNLCSMLDKKKTGTINWIDFEQQMQNEVMVAYMEVVGLQVYELELFFRLLSGGDIHEAISIDRFVEGCMQMKGGATAIDMQRQIFELTVLKSKLTQFAATTHDELQQCLMDIQYVASVMASETTATGACKEPALRL